MSLKKWITGLLGMTLTVNMTVLPLQAEEKSFSDFEDELFVELLESDYTTMHFAVEDYASYGIEKPETTIGTAEWDYDEYIADAEEDLNALHQFDYDSLSKEEQTDYDAIEFYLESMIALNEYPYFDFKFHASSGILDSLTTVFTEYVFKNQEDIEDYLTILATVPDYLDQCIEITKKQAEKGYFLTDSQLSDTKELISKFTSKTDDNELIVIFDENIDAFEGLSDEEKENYKQRNKDLVLNEYIPAYLEVESELEKLQGSRKGQYNVCSLEDGEEYYTALAKYKTSLDTDVQTMLDLCTEYLQKAVSELTSAYMSNMDALGEQIPLTDAETILSYLESHMDNFPEIEKVNYTAEYLDPSVASDSIVAYYMSPQLDNTNNNVIKINGDNVSDTTYLYITLAHEGFPGHLYQTNYYLQSDPALIRTQIAAMGYTEGWGMYASMQALDASNLSSEAATINGLNIAIGYVLDAALDLGVNGLGWGTSDISDYLNEIGLDDGSAKDYYDFVTSQPGEILPYGVGLAMFESLEDKAKETLGDNFDQKEFNTVLLDGGSRPFESVEDDVNEYLGIEDTDENNIVPHTHSASSSSSSTSASTPSSSLPSEKPSAESKQVNWILYGGIGIGVAAVGVIALIIVIKTRKDDPFA